MESKLWPNHRREPQRAVCRQTTVHLLRRSTDPSRRTLRRGASKLHRRWAHFCAAPNSSISHVDNLFDKMLAEFVNVSLLSMVANVWLIFGLYVDHNID